MSPSEAIVLVGGLGTRLRPVVSHVPKPLAPIAGRPFLFWLMDGLARQGVTRAVLATGYMAHSVRAAIGTDYAGMDIVYVQENEPRGTGGALWAAMPFCSGERVFVLNGDSWIGVPLAGLGEAFPTSDIVLTVRPVLDRRRYGGVLVAEGRVLGFEEKGLTGPGLVNAGVYVLRRDLIERRPMPATFSLETELLAKPNDLDVRAYRTDADFIDIGTPDDFAAAQGLVPLWASGAVR